MKKVFSLLAAVAVLASAQASFGASCAATHKGSRQKLIEPKSTVKSSTVKSQSQSVRR